MPTGIALRDAREQLFAAAERVLSRDGVVALTSRSVTAEAGLAKGVLHRYFPDFDSFLAAYVSTRILALGEIYDTLVAGVGRHSVLSNVSDALIDAFTPANLRAISIAASRPGVRAHLRSGTPRGIALLAQLTGGLAAYLRAEQRCGRLLAAADAAALAFALVATAHLLFAGELGGLPDRAAVEEVAESILVGALAGTTGD